MPDQIAPAALAVWLAGLPTGTQPLLLDVREPWECQLASVTPQGFALRALPMHKLPESLAELDPQQPTACLCHHGMRSQQVALFLQQQGFDSVVNIHGGIDAWSRTLDPRVPRY